MLFKRFPVRRGFLSTAALLASLSPLSAQTEAARPQIRATIVTLRNYNAWEKARIDSALVLVTRVVNDSAFQAAVLGYGRGDPSRSFVHKDGLPLARSNEEVWTAFARGEEEYEPGPDGEMDLHLVGKKQFLGWPFGWPSYPVGYGKRADDPPIYTYHTWIRENSIPALAGHLVHEWTHKIGFEHDYKVTETRPCSVPYVVGNLVEFFAEQLVASPETALRAPRAESKDEEFLVHCQTPHVGSLGSTITR